MATFDIIFSGNVRAGFDADEVKQHLGALLQIESEAELARLFSGHSVILRRKMARKEAAALYQDITNLGGEAELSPSPSGRPRRTSITLGEREDSNSLAHIWPPADALPLHRVADSSFADTQHIEADLKSELEHNLQQQQALAEQMTQIKTEAHRGSARFERRTQHFERVATRDLEALEQQRKEAQKQAQDASSQLDQAIDVEQRKAAYDLRAVRAERQRTLSESRANLAKMGEQTAALERESSEQNTTLINQKALLEQQEAAEIARLEALIQATKDHTAIALAELDAAFEPQQLRRDTEHRKLLEQQQVLEEHTEYLINALDQQETAINTALAHSVENLQQHDTQRQAAEAKTLADIETAFSAVVEKRQRGMQRAKRADAIERDANKAALSRIHAEQMELSRRESDILAELQRLLLAKEHAANEAPHQAELAVAADHPRL